MRVCVLGDKSSIFSHAFPKVLQQQCSQSGSITLLEWYTQNQAEILVLCQRCPLVPHLLSSSLIAWKLISRPNC